MVHSTYQHESHPRVMIARHAHGTSEWIDCVSPSKEEIRELIERAGIPPEFGVDLSGPLPRSSTLYRDETIKLTMDFPVVKHERCERAREIKIILTANRLITVHYADVAGLDRFAKELEVASSLKKTVDSPAALFIALMQTLHAGLHEKLDYLETHLSDIEERIFDGQEKELVIDISRTSQKLVSFRQAIIEHDTLLTEMSEYIRDLFGTEYGEQARELADACAGVRRRLDALSANAVELRETNNSLLSTKQNEIMKILTIMAFVTFPLSLIASLFGMNTETLPLVGTPGDFWFILGGMLLGTACFFAFFKYKRWM
jgi:magnesium transporter